MRSKQRRDNRSKVRSGAGAKGSGRRRGGGQGAEADDDDEEEETEEMDVGTRHEELVYWYTAFEDPNCIAVVELVATIVDIDSGIQVCLPRRMR